jgi:hypothetical protein
MSCIDDLPSRCDKTQLVVVLKVLGMTRGLVHEETAALPADLSSKIGCTPQNLRRVLRQISLPAPGEEEEPLEEGEAEETSPNLALLEFRWVNGKKQYRALDENFTKAPIRAPRTLTRKPPRSEGIEDAPAEFAPELPVEEGYAEVSNPLPRAAFHHAAPEAVMVVFPNGRTIPLNPECPQCQSVEKAVTENKGLTGSVFLKRRTEGEKRNSSFAVLDRTRADLLAAINEVLSPTLLEDLKASNAIWKDVCRILEGVPDDPFIAKVTRTASTVRSYPILRALAISVAESHRRRASKPTKFQQFADLVRAGTDPGDAGFQCGLDTRTIDEYLNQIRGGPNE